MVPSYVEENLIEGEDLIFLGRISRWTLIGHLIGVFALMVVGFLVLSIVLTIVPALIWMGFVYLKYISTELAVTSKRIFVKTGILNRCTNEIYLSKVEGVHIDQPLLGRIFNYGTVEVSGVGTEVAPIKNMADPMVFRKKFLEAADNLVEKK